MLAWAKNWFSPKPQGRQTPADSALFQPPEDVRARHDTIDDLIAADRAHLTPGKRALLFGATLAVSAGSLGGANPIEVRQVWGQQDVYSGARQTSKPDPAE